MATFNLPLTLTFFEVPIPTDQEPTQKTDHSIEQRKKFLMSLLFIISNLDISNNEPTNVLILDDDSSFNYINYLLIHLKKVMISLTLITGQNQLINDRRIQIITSSFNEHFDFSRLTQSLSRRSSKPPIVLSFLKNRKFSELTFSKLRTTRMIYEIDFSEETSERLESFEGILCHSPWNGERKSLFLIPGQAKVKRLFEVSYFSKNLERFNLYCRQGPYPNSVHTFLKGIKQLPFDESFDSTAEVNIWEAFFLFSNLTPDDSRISNAILSVKLF